MLFKDVKLRPHADQAATVQPGGLLSARPPQEPQGCWVPHFLRGCHGRPFLFTTVVGQTGSFGVSSYSEPYTDREPHNLPADGGGDG